jgi:hypothetical protein
VPLPPETNHSAASVLAAVRLIEAFLQILDSTAKLVQRVRHQVEMRRRFDAAAATICSINLTKFLKQKQEP